MDMNTLMSMIGMFGGSTGGANPEIQARRYTPGLADFSQLGAATVPAPVAAPVEQAPVAPQFGHGSQGNPADVLSAAPAAHVAPATHAPVRKGGFSTGNILTALLGSNFGA
ncbi:hypothetical protein [Sphingomonas rubra]|uniref:hypothetical protein n=1 Tax=Sphingomonas rubra TaxID=634430 RepID=UPI001160C858|nr:hypothetical protein [Sphingomonas rubra]